MTDESQIGGRSEEERQAAELFNQNQESEREQIPETEIRKMAENLKLPAEQL